MKTSNATQRHPRKGDTKAGPTTVKEQVAAIIADELVAAPSGTADPFHTTEEVAERYRTAASTVRYWRHLGAGPKGVKIGTRVLYRESELIRWEREQEAEQAANDKAAAS